MITFADPIFLILIIPSFIFLLPSKKNIKVPSFKSHTIERSTPFLLSKLSQILISIVYILLVVSLAGPLWGIKKKYPDNKGIAIEMILDRSGSMGVFTDPYSGVRRIDLAKSSYIDFIDKRPNDLIGLISFSKYVETLCPLTMSHEVLKDFTDNIDIVKTKEEDGTSLGDALLLGASRLKELDIKSKIIVLLTDGNSNSGQYTTNEALNLIENWGIKVYTIGFNMEGYVIQNTLFGQQTIPVQSSVDQKILKSIASSTGGQFILAGNNKELKNAIEAINNLELDEMKYNQEDFKKNHYRLFLYLSYILLLVFVFIDTFIVKRLDL
ncbi:vWA domain-containing protein [Spirochaeta cellobiosiphila]|uniref:vWA domain-containing protein n=1 Tax=Spirochaeta cellobiosiphila TaxID=504483 RepID=UPI0003F62D04|nr:VWA domain-containing protein [Spirochaeta cellobiosiphila]